MPNRNQDALFVLGAQDPEMNAIKALLDLVHMPFVFAKDATGTRVHPGNAYAYKTERVSVPAGTTVVLVECRPDLTGGPSETIVVDHHRPGDPGFGAPPEQFWTGSSIGQAYNLLLNRFNIPAAKMPTGMKAAEHRIIAAADHCLAAAYRGECLGIDPLTVRYFRAISRSTFLGISVKAYLDKVDEAVRALDRTRTQREDGIADLGNQTVDEAPEASAQSGIPFTAIVPDKSGRQKIVLQGADPGTIEAWIKTQKELGRETYGDPQRGFAGAYTT